MRRIFQIFKDTESQQVTDALLALVMVYSSTLFFVVWLGFIKFYEFLTF